MPIPPSKRNRTTTVQLPSSYPSIAHPRYMIQVHYVAQIKSFQEPRTASRIALSPPPPRFSPITELLREASVPNQGPKPRFKWLYLSTGGGGGGEMGLEKSHKTTFNCNRRPKIHIKNIHNQNQRSNYGFMWLTASQ